MNKTCFALLKESLDKYGDHVAVIDGTVSLKLSELISCCERLSLFFASKGLGKGDCVTAVLPDSAGAVTVFYALSRAGISCNFVQYGADEIFVSRSIETCRSSAVIRNNVISFPGRNENISLEEATGYAGDIVPESPESNDKAVYINGGGTEGKYKTVILSDRNINTVAENLSFIFRDRGNYEAFSLLALPVSHSFGMVASMHLPLVCGLGVVCMHKFDASEAAALIRKHEICFLTGIPEMYEKLYSSEEFKGEFLKKIRYAFCGGDFVPESLTNRFNTMLESYGSSASLYTGYGLSETASVCSVNTDYGNKPGSVGRILDGVNVRISDSGEILVSGDTVMTGYTDGSENMTADENGIRWLMTGDIGHIDSEGYLFISGRKKRIIVVSGHNVYPGDIEKCVSRLPFVRECCVCGAEYDGGRHIYLYVCTDGTPEEGFESVINMTISDSLSDYCVPKKIVLLNALPRTPFGKVDYKKLTEMSGEQI